ncbi:OLC1v1026151C1 [Oldenlandia corymbosa var. corymbosa]|uniref:OLC1v1026151C1 n=1 Tax=Oldenlandia corymbosa var. corymbosa TaxID=529605 RepID=A0AAV1C773_OLDCO|nr:OLC1v1026151C1 [Oldenlandia corymbosa var. corymbosa]
MEDQCSPLNWAYYYQDEGIHGIDELKHSLLYATLELESTVLSAKEELARKDDELMALKSLLSRTTKERDEALLNTEQPVAAKPILSSGTTTTTSNEDEPRRGDSYTGISSSDCDENVIVSPAGKDSVSAKTELPLLHHQAFTDLTDKIELKKPLPEKGKFLQAVMEAGPLLQTLLLAGPLPQWQHPPPQLSAIDIPPVTISSPRPRLLQHQDSCLSTCSTKKRVFPNSTEQCCDSSSSPRNSKYQRVVHQSSLTSI